jgi:hypothetical protein
MCFQVSHLESKTGERTVYQQTVMPVVVGQKRTWAPNSTEAVKRERALTDLFAGTELTTQLTKHKEFREFCSALDPKFKLPGGYCGTLISL